jgi:hypothetical protein
MIVGSSYLWKKYYYAAFLKNMEIKKKSGLPPQRYFVLKVHTLNCVFFKCRLKSSVFIVIYDVDDCGK